jgi:hypothetical protein
VAERPVALPPVIAGCMMVQQLSGEIAECYRRASESRDRAKLANDSALRQDFLDMERRWILLAHSYEFSERISSLPVRPGGNKYCR